MGASYQCRVDALDGLLAGKSVKRSLEVLRDESVPIGEETGGFFEKFPQFKEVEPIAGVMKAGDAGIHNGLTAHGAGPNMTPGWRRAMTCAYMPDGATFNGQQNILSDEQVAELEVGDVLDDESQNPLIWSKAMESASNGA